MAERKGALLVLGAGAWGTALGSRIASDSGVTVKLWSRSEKLATLINKSRVNQDYLPEIQLSENLTASSNLSGLISWLKNEPEDTLRCVLLATASKGFYQICSKLQEFNLQNLIFVSLCKGVIFFEGKNYFPSEIIKRYFPKNHVCILSGPSFANEVARGLPFAISCSSDDLNLARKLSIVLSSEGMRVYAISENIGVEVSGAMKNVLGIESAVCNGLCLGLMARA